MKTLNEITQRQDQDTFNNYRAADWEIIFAAMTDEEKAGLQERLTKLEEISETGDFGDLDKKADGFTDDEYEEFSGMDLFDELMILRLLC